MIRSEIFVINIWWLIKMNNSSDEENFEKWNINPSSAEDLLKEDIDFAESLFNDTKFQQLDSPYYTSDKLINFLRNSQKVVFLFFI